MIERNMLLTTSDSIPFSKIDKHLGVDDAQVVVGANIFRDFFAGVRDIVGGETKGYTKDLDKMKMAAKRNLISQAKELGANAIISLRMDLNEVSGGGKSMFMFIMYGSAVEIHKDLMNSEKNFSRLKKLSNEDLKFYKKRNKLKKRIESENYSSSNNNIEQISKYRLWEYELLNNEFNYIKNKINLSTYNYYEDLVNKNFNKIPIKLFNKYIDDNLSSLNENFWKIILNALEKSNWSNSELIKKLLQDENHIKRFRALQLCRIKKEVYEEKDANILKEIGEFLRNDFDHSYPIREVDKMVGKKKVFTCPNCLTGRKKDDKSEDSICKCGANKYGLKPGSLSPKSISKDLIENSEAIKSAFEDMNK